jgi:hypothetical protein
MAPFNPDIPSDNVDPMKHNSTWALDILPEGTKTGNDDPSYKLTIHWDIFSKLI